MKTELLNNLTENSVKDHTTHIKVTNDALRNFSKGIYGFTQGKDHEVPIDGIYSPEEMLDHMKRIITQSLLGHSSMSGVSLSESELDFVGRQLATSEMALYSYNIVKRVFDQINERRNACRASVSEEPRHSNKNNLSL